VPPFRASNDVFYAQPIYRKAKIEPQLIRTEISYVGVNNYDLRRPELGHQATLASCRTNGSPAGGRASGPVATASQGPR
jgi:hypothetical protein